MNVGAFLRGVKLVHLESGQNEALVAGQIEGLPRREGMRPVARADIVVRAGLESPGGREKTVHSPDRDAFPPPTQDHRQIIRIRESSATAYSSCDIRCETVLGHRKR